MKIVYFSKTNNIRRFVEKTGFAAICGQPDLLMDDAFILISYSKGFGETPDEVTAFLDNNDTDQYLRGICASGNKNWGHLYCKSGHDLARKYNSQVLMTFELAGNEHDVNKFVKIIEELDA